MRKRETPMSWDFIWYWLLPRLGLVFVGFLACSTLFVLWVLFDNRRDAHMRARQHMQHDAHTAPYLPTAHYQQSAPHEASHIDWEAVKRDAIAEVDRRFREATSGKEE